MAPQPTHERVQPQDHQPAGEPGEPLTHDHNRETKPLTLGPIGWSYRRVGLSSACRPALDALVHSVPQADGGTSGIRCHLSCRDSLIPEAAGVVSCRHQLRRLSPRAGAVTRRAQSHSCGAHRFAGLG